MPIFWITSQVQEKQQKSIVSINNAVLHRCFSYKCGDSAPTPPPGRPFSTQPRQSDGGGDGFPSFAMGGRNTPTPTKKYDASAFAFDGGNGKTSNEVNSNNNSTRKHKSPRAMNKDGGDNDASMELPRDRQIIPPKLLANVEEQMKKNSFEGN
jgi:hypothetical protein